MSSTGYDSGWPPELPDQRRILREGNAYLLAEYPKLDFVKTATIEAAPRQRGRTELLARWGESASGSSSTLRTKISSGSAPRISIDPLTIVLGTPVTRNLRVDP